jgi:hypothetical protein
MKFRRSDLPSRHPRSESSWDRTVSAELRREMRLNPGVTYQLLDDHGEPAAFHPLDYAALVKAAPRPYRVQSRAVPGKMLAGKAFRYVWVSLDPGHWEHVKTRATQS